MVFSSPTFLFVFLPVVLLVYHALPVTSRLRNFWLLAASAVFYYWGAGDAIVAILFVAFTSFFGTLIGWLIMRKPNDDPARRRRTVRWVVGVLVTLVLLPLLIFKYIPQLAGYDVPGLAGVLGNVSASSWVLPLGISFFTFHAISFVVDSAKNGEPLTRSFWNYLLYLFLFPHQIAGPIVRYSELGDQITAVRRISATMLGYGITRFTWGLTKKVLIADNAGVIVDAVFTSAATVSGQLSAPAAWLGALAYTVQIYFDFSGYSDMAIGIAMMFGFRFPENFNSPYASTSITDFWRRWHMTLTHWFRDYIYIPLGGNRRGPLVEYGALLLVFLLTSLWHGATIGFLVWGGLHSAALLFERLTGLRRVKRFVAVRRFVTFVFVVLAWVPFRSSTFAEALHVWHAMITGSWQFISPLVLVTLTPVTVAALVLGLLAAFGSRKRTGFQLLFRAEGPAAVADFRWKWALVVTPILLLLSMFAVLWSEYSPFLYFKF